MSARASSTVDTTKTTTSTSSRQSGVRRKPLPIAETPSVLSVAGAVWATMSGEERNSYAAARRAMADTLEPTAPVRKTAWDTFVQLSAANLAAGKPLDKTATPYTPAVPLSAVSVVATYINGVLKITMTPEAPYPHAVALKCARPILAADNVYTSTAFKRIGSIPSFSGTVDITDLFLSRYRIYGTGYKIALELMGVAPGGYHTGPLHVFGLVGNTAQEAAQVAPEEDGGTLELG